MLIRVAALQTKVVGTKYLSERERDPEREGDGSRLLFNHQRDDLTHSQADRILTGMEVAGRPHVDDLYHLVFSPQEAQDYERLGDDAHARISSFRECARDAMTVFEREMKVRDVRWAAAVHLNTDNPHVHILIHRDMTEATTGDPWRLDHIPRELLMHRQGVQVEDASPPPPPGQEGAEHEGSKVSDEPRHLIPNTTKELVRCDGRLGEAFAQSMRDRSLPLRQIAFRMDHADQYTRREIIDLHSSHQTSPEEITVGKWIIAELRNGPIETPQQMQERHTLRLAVEQLDARSRACGETPARAYLPEKTWRELIRENKVQALCQDGTLASRYHYKDEMKGDLSLRFDQMRPAHGGHILGFRTYDSGRLVAREVIPVIPDPQVRPSPDVNSWQEAKRPSEIVFENGKEVSHGTSNGKGKAQLEHVTPERPCPVCHRLDNCATTPDGRRAYCRRVETAEDERGQKLDYAKLKEGRDGGWWVDLTKLPDYTPREFSPHVEVTKYPLAPIERRDQVYRAMLGKLDFLSRDGFDLDRRGMDEGAQPRVDYKTVPSKVNATRIARELCEEGHDLRGVPGLWREDEDGKDYSSEAERWRLNLNHWYRGYMIPVKDHEGRIEGFQIRRSDPKTFTNSLTGKEEKEPKYVWLSSDNTERKSRPEGTSPGSPIHFSNVERIRESGHAIITEGALKGDIAAQYLDHGVITVQGVGNFPTDFGRRLREQLPELRTVSVAYDADLVHNKAVAKQSDRLRATLESAGLETGVLRWNEQQGKGIDDYLKNRLGDDFHDNILDPVMRGSLRKAALKEIGYTEAWQIMPGMRDTATGRIVRCEGCAVADWMRSETSQEHQPEPARLFLHRMNVRSLDATAIEHGKPVCPAAMHPAEINEAISSGKILTHEQLIAEQKSEDRLRLGDELRTRLELKHALWQLNQARDFRELTRYTVHDDSTKVRRPLSLDDLGQRGTARAYRATDEGQDRIDSAGKSDRHALRQEIFDARKESDEKNHQGTINSIRSAHSKRIYGLERSVGSAHHAHDEARPLAFRVERSYRAANEPTPVSLIDRQTLDQLHEDAYERRDTPTIKELDELRHHLCSEAGEPAHNEESARRLAAQTRMTGIDAETARRREARFRENAHNRLWTIEGEDKEWSLSAVDREIERRGREHDFHMGRADFFGRHGFVSHFVQGKVQGMNPLNSLRLSAFSPLNPILNDPAVKTIRFGIDLYRWSVQAQEAKALATEALAQREHLEANVRTSVVDQIKEHAKGLGAQTDEAQKCAETLRQMHDTEGAERTGRGLEVARPSFKDAELRRMEASSGTLRDPELLHEYEGIVQERLRSRAQELRDLISRGSSPEEIARSIVESRIRSAMKELPVTDKQEYTIQKALADGKTFADGSAEKPQPANRMEASEQIEELTGRPAAWRLEADKAVEEMIAGGKVLTPEAVEARLQGDLAARAVARQILAEARYSQSEIALARFGEHRETMAVAYQDEAGALRTASLRNVEPKDALDVISRFFDSTDSEVYAREMVRQQLDVRELNLSAELDVAEEWQQATKEIADAYQADLSVETVLPQFTAREASELERFGGGLSPEEIEELAALPELTDSQQQQLYYSQTVQDAFADERVGYIELPQALQVEMLVQQPESIESIAEQELTPQVRLPEEITSPVTSDKEIEEEMARISEDKHEVQSSPEPGPVTGEMEEHDAQLKHAGGDGAAGSPEQPTVQEIVEEMLQEEVEVEEAAIELL